MLVTLLVVLFLLAGAVCFGLAAFRVAMRLELVALGLLFWILCSLIPAIMQL